LGIALGWCNPSLAANDNEVVPANKSQVSILFGGYNLSSDGISTNSIGSLTLGFTYRFHPKFSAIASYNNLMSFSPALSSLVSGIDIGAQYCFLTCSAMKQRVADSATVVSWNPWGIQVGAGFAQRTFQLQQNISYSGPFGKVEVNYMLGDRFKVLGSSQYTYMVNASKTLSHITYQIGLGFDFGENVFEAARRPQTTH
jgi:hypothetical protein